MIVVADASPLIALARIGRLELLRTIFERLLLPEAVWREVVAAGLNKAGAGTVMQADWIDRRKVADAGMVGRCQCREFISLRVLHGCTGRQIVSSSVGPTQRTFRPAHFFLLA